MERQLRKNYFAIKSTPAMGVDAISFGQGSFYVKKCNNSRF